LARTGQAEGFDLGFAVVKSGLGTKIGAAGFAIGALVETEKNVPLVVRRRVGGGGFTHAAEL
jgi:hypothetical protein